MKHKIYITLAMICFAAGCGIDLDRLGVWKALALSGVIWAGFIWCALHIEAGEDWEEGNQ